MAKKKPPEAPPAFNRHEYLRRLLRERLGAILQLLLEDSLLFLHLGAEDHRPRLPQDRCEGLLDDLIHCLETQWQANGVPAGSALPPATPAGGYPPPASAASSPAGQSQREEVIP